jgi:immune inhibitor A
MACGGGSVEGPQTPTPAPSSVASATPSATPSPGPAPVTPADRDLLELAVRLGQAPAPLSPIAKEEPPAYAVGDRHEFATLDVFEPSVVQVTAVLRLVTPHAYFYVEDGADVSEDDLEKAGRDFEERVYPAVVERFGSEWTPGVDRDPHITLLHAELKGLAGYFNGDDEVPRAASPYSNEREMVYLDAGSAKPGSDGYAALLAHELQHLVHWRADPTEEIWVNEGLSEVAREMIDGSPGSIASAVASPDVQLNAWEPSGQSNTTHYGISHLLFRYLLEHYGGPESVRRLLEEPVDGIEGIERYLDPFGVTFSEVFADWLVANYLDDPAGGPYSHGDAEVRASPTVNLTDYGEGEDSVHQFAADYIEVQLSEGDAIFSFEGDTAVGLLPNEPHNGSGQWWSGRGDAIDSTLTAEFDLSGLESATLGFWTWYNLEEHWDHAYVMASGDGGETWQILGGQHTTDADPVGNAYGPAYTGRSGGGDQPTWVEESIDLSPLAGGKVLLRFEAITDAAVNLEGWAVDDIAIPELGFLDDAEDEGPREGQASAWQARGFQRLTAPLPQRFIVQVIEMAPDGPPPGGETTSVRTLRLDAANRGKMRLSGFGSTLDKAVVIVAAATDGTTETAAYRYELRAAP